MERNADFADVLGSYVARDGRNPNQLSQQTGKQFGLYHKIPKETLYRWLNGSVQHPRSWQDIARLAVVLRLTRAETDMLLLAAEHGSLDTLRRQAQPDAEMQLLGYWVNGKETAAQAPPAPAAQVLLADMPTFSIPTPGPLPPGSRLLLPPNPLFVGRAAALRTLAQALKNNQTVALTGLAGVGKTQLAVEFAHRYGRYFPGGVFWLSFADAEAVPAQIAVCGGLYGLGLTPDFDDLPVNRQVEMVLRAWRDPLPRLLIFDNCEEETLLTRWRPAYGGCCVLITSRRARWDLALGVTPLPLAVLTRQESISLLRRFCADIPQADAAKIAAALGDLPLALHLAGNYLYNYQSDVTPLVYLTQLRALREQFLEHPSLQGWGIGYSPTGHETHVALTLSFSANRLNPADETDALAQALLARAACFAPNEPIPNHLLRATLFNTRYRNGMPTTPLPVADALSRLLALGLIQESHDRAFIRLHHLLAAFVHNLGSDAQAQSDVETAVLSEAERLNKRRNPGPLRVWDIHLYHLTTMAQERQDARAADLCHTLAEYLQLSGKYDEARSYFERALEIRCRVLGGDHADTATTLHCLGALLGEMKRFAEAQPYLVEALRVREQIWGMDHLNVAETLSVLGEGLLAAGKLSEAQPCLDRALAIHKRQLGAEHTQTAISFAHLGALCQARGEFTAARSYYQQAQAVRERLFDTDFPRTATSLINLGILLKDMGNLAAAAPLLEQALTIFELKLGFAHPHTAVILRHLGLLSQAAGDQQKARAYLERALAARELALGLEHPETAELRAELAALP